MQIDKRFQRGVPRAIRFMLYDATTLQPKTDIALAEGDVTVTLGDAAPVTVPLANLPTVVNGRWVWTPPVAYTEVKGGVHVQVRNAAYDGLDITWETYGDARADEPDTAQVHSGPVSSVTVNGCVLDSAPTLPAGPLVAVLLTAFGEHAAPAVPATVAGANVTFDPPLTTAPTGAAQIHLYVDVLARPLTDETLGTVNALAGAERTAIAGEVASHATFATMATNVTGAKTSADDAKAAADAAAAGVAALPDATTVGTRFDAVDAAVAALPPAPSAAAILSEFKADAEWESFFAHGGRKFTVTWPSTFPGTGVVVFYEVDGTTVFSTHTITYDSAGRPTQRTIVFGP